MLRSPEPKSTEPTTPTALENLEYCTVPSGMYDIGWRFDGALPDEVRSALDAFWAWPTLATSFSPRRTAELAEYHIARESVSLEQLIGDPYELARRVTCIRDVCDAVEAVLRPAGLRLPTEDELEAACGGELFWWGMRVPDGIPYGSETSFEDHRKQNARGIILNPDPYRVELVRECFKLGDGGEAICGGDPWPIAWLALSPSWRVDDAQVADLLAEHLETTFVRPVRIG